MQESQFEGRNHNWLFWIILQVDSPMNLKHPHDLVILMRQETTVNYLKELEVRLV